MRIKLNEIKIFNFFFIIFLDNGINGFCIGKLEHTISSNLVYEYIFKMRSCLYAYSVARELMADWQIAPLLCYLLKLPIGGVHIMLLQFEVFFSWFVPNLFLRFYYIDL